VGALRRTLLTGLNIVAGFITVFNVFNTFTFIVLIAATVLANTLVATSDEEALAAYTAFTVSMCIGFCVMLPCTLKHTFNTFF